MSNHEKEWYRVERLTGSSSLQKEMKNLYFRDGIRHAEMLAFPFATAREPAKLAKRVSSGFVMGK